MDVSATDISARTFPPRTFRQCKMPKVDVSAITIKLCTFECIDLVGSMLMCVGEMYVHLFTCMHAGCMPYPGLAVDIFLVLQLSLRSIGQ